MKLIVTRIGKKFTVVIPREIREKIPLKEGESVVWEVEGEKIMIKPTSFIRLSGIVKSSALLSAKEMRKTLGEELEKDAEEALGKPS